MHDVARPDISEMGIDTHSLNLLRYARLKYGDLGNTITLGRLAVLLGPRAARQWAGTDQGAWCEPLLQEKFGATSVDSIDNSAYEGATIVADFNQPIASQLEGRYDTVIDFGCSEHIFDVAQSLRNVSALCRPNGTILHYVPSNGACGHGFYQFSPELFWSWYSPSNGYTETEVFLADLCEPRYWYRVPRPVDGQRVNVRSFNDLYVLVATRRTHQANAAVQQSDYAFTWSQTSAQSPPHRPGRLAALREILFRTPITARIVDALDNHVAQNGARRVKHHPKLTRIAVEGFIHNAKAASSSMP